MKDKFVSDNISFPTSNEIYTNSNIKNNNLVLSEKLIDTQNSNNSLYNQDTQLVKDIKFDAYKGTLHEPVYATLKRDLIRIKNKLVIVILPITSKEKEKELRHWDLWGPFLFCLLLGLILMFTSEKSATTVFTTIFIITWLGSIIITINTTLLGGEISYLQCMCLIGYCLFPITLGAFLNKVVLKFIPKIIKLLIAFAAFFWSIKASAAFLTQSIHISKRNLAIYPIILFYLFLTWFIK